MNFSKEVKVALLAIVAIAALYFGYWFLRGSNLFSGTHTYYAQYDDVEGLTASNPVMLNGVNVGLVKKLQILTEKDNHILVTLEIDKDIQVGDSTVANLVSSDLLGSKAIVLEMGKNSRIYEGGETLKTMKEQGITDILASKGTQLADRIDSTIIIINDIFDEKTRRNIRASMEHAEASTRTMQALLENNQRNINQITANLNSLTASLRTTERKFSQLASSLNEFADTLKQAEINEMVRNINETVLEAQTAMQKLNQNEGSLGKLMNDDSLYTNLNRSAESLNALLEDLKAYPKRYVHFSLIGRRDKYKVDKEGKVERVEKAKTSQ